ncbi:SAM-dependent methyltransferase [Streptomyces albofaciens JCM 4342]|uniref:methyltransferase n=1 Tax=Streptomyces albofaciens TaxID=66866 RepID=UPI00123A08DF|nr:methyltransferase [Streptomyces albofaciens]KAA6222795.1 SAM-dependent methyltransferase [Streptomyces albofaciens JCM 4342]
MAPAPQRPAVQLTEHALAYLHSAALRAAALLGVADHLADGPRTAGELAAATGADAGYLRRVLRLLATREVFREDAATGAFHLTPAADPLRSDAPSSMRDAVIMLTDDPFWRPAGRLADTVRSGRTVFDEIFGVPYFAHLERVPEAGGVFDTGMAGLAESENDPIAAAYDFPATGTVVDVGGGRGGLLRQVLRRNPGLTGVLYDQESVLRHHTLDLPDLTGRWQTAAGDFFTAVPPGADVYLLKRILHDWNDADCLRILRACRTAMTRPGSRLLAIDAVLPPGNSPHPGKTMDVLMMTSLNGRERDEPAFHQLLTEAGLKPGRTIPTESTLSVVEAVAG